MILVELFPYAHAVFYVLAALYALTIISIITVIISENRNPVKSLGWVTVLLVVPILGLLLYLVFGRSLKGRRLIPAEAEVKLKGYSMPEPMDVSQLPISESSRQMVQLVNTLGDPHFLVGNQVRMFTEGADMLASLKADLQAAKRYINLEFYIFMSDDTGQEIANVLIERAKAGVQVNVIYDHVGSWNMTTKFYRRLRQGGVEAYPFLKITISQLANRLNWRNHRKLVVVDGRVAYIGGMNIADRYVTGERGQQPWRDTHLRIVGPIEKGLRLWFAIDWNFMRRQLLVQPDAPSYNLPPDGGMGMQVVGSGPTARWNGMSMVFLRAIAVARSCIWIQTPYFLPADAHLKALIAAAMSGVDVRIMIPQRPDSTVMRYSSFSYVKECLQAGIKVYLYQQRMLHAKCVIVDDEFVTTGSTNFDFRSFEHNFECNVLVYDKSFNAQMKQVFLADIQAGCLRPSLEQWKRRPKRQRAAESLSRLLGPVL